MNFFGDSRWETDTDGARVMLGEICRLAGRWHELQCELAAMEMTGVRWYTRRIRELEEELDERWERRRRLRARLLARQLPAELVVERMTERTASMVHVEPCC